MANTIKFNLNEINREFAGKFCTFYGLKKTASYIRSRKAFFEHALAEVEVKLEEALKPEYPDADRIKALEGEKAPLAEKISKLSEELKQTNAALKAHVAEIVPPEMYKSYVYGVESSDFDAKTKEIKSFTTQIAIIANELGGHNITDGACRRFAKEVETHIGSKTTNGKDLLNGKLVRELSQRQFNIAMVQIMLEVFTSKYKLFTFNSESKTYEVSTFETPTTEEIQTNN